MVRSHLPQGCRASQQPKFPSLKNHLRVSSPSGGGRSGLLRQREPRVVEKHTAGGGQLDPASAAGHEYCADFHLEVTNLAA